MTKIIFKNSIKKTRKDTKAKAKKFKKKKKKKAQCKNGVFKK
jgi:hypothetical protein